MCQFTSSLFTYPWLGWRGTREGLASDDREALVVQTLDLGLEGCLEFWKAEVLVGRICQEEGQLEQRHDNLKAEANPGMVSGSGVGER